MSDPPDTKAEAVERIRLYVDYPHTSRDMVVLDSALVRLTAGDLADLLAERDTLAAERDALRAERDRYLRHLTAGAQSINDFKARAEAAEAARDEALKMLTEDELAHNRRVNAMIRRHADQIVALRARADLADALAEALRIVDADLRSHGFGTEGRMRSTARAALTAPSRPSD